MPELNTILNSNNNILQKEDIVNAYSMQEREKYSIKEGADSVPALKEGESIKALIASKSHLGTEPFGDVHFLAHFC